MKDITSHVASKSTRNSFYSKKRPSPHGIAKSRRTPSCIPASVTASRVTPAQQRARTVLQQQREAQALLMGQDGKLLEEEYRAEVMKYMHDMEQCTLSSAPSMDQQPEIKWHMRPCLVDFLVEAHLVFKLRPETLYLTLNIIDRYCSRRVVFIKHFQLVGCAALWIAAKFEDAKERVPSVHDLHEICREAFELTAFIQMEYHVLTTIQWIVGHPTAEAWLRLACCGLYVEDQRTGHVARFLMEITLFHREYVPFTPSNTSKGALILARAICGRPRRLVDETEEAFQVAILLDLRLSNHLSDVSEILVKKYGYAFYSKASTVVVQFYLAGNRLQQHMIPDASPVTPLRAPRTSALGIPTSISSSTSFSSVSSDDMPQTPTSNAYPHDLFAVTTPQDSQKENNRPASIPPTDLFVKRGAVDAHDATMFPRPALQTLNGLSSSPRPMVH